MSRWIGLLRAVNVGGRKLAMADLRHAMEQAAFTNIRTLLASGNVVFDAKAGTASKLETKIEAAIKAQTGLETDVMVRSPMEMAAVVAANPFPRQARADPAHLVTVFYKTTPDLDQLKAYLGRYKGPETVKAIGRELFIVFPQGIGPSKFLLPKKVGAGTMRNWNTVLKLLEMASG